MDAGRTSRRVHEEELQFSATRSEENREDDHETSALETKEETPRVNRCRRGGRIEGHGVMFESG